MKAKQHILNRLSSKRINPIVKDCSLFEKWEEVKKEEIKNKEEHIDLLSQCIEALEANHATCFRVVRENLPDKMQEIMKQDKLKRVTIGNNQFTDELFFALQDKFDIQRYENDFHFLKKELFHDVELGVSLASAAISDTGALIIHTSKNEPRTLSLIPPHHFIMVKASSLFSNLTSYFQSIKKEKLPTNLVLISGPSKTADIQQTLAYGAHGPENVTVFFILDM